MEYLIGIDIGTTGAKTVIFGADGSTVASAFEEYPLRHPRPGWAEQNPQDWWEATVKSIRRVLQTSRISLANLRGLSLSGQMHGAVLLGRDHQVLRPCIIWSDQRSAAQAEWINQTVGRERLLQVGAASPRPPDQRPGPSQPFQCAAQFLLENDRDGNEQRREGFLDQPAEGTQADEAGQECDSDDEQDHAAQQGHRPRATQQVQQPEEYESHEQDVEDVNPVEPLQIPQQLRHGSGSEPR